MASYRAVKWEKAFLATYAINCNISESAKASGIDRQSVYKRQREHPEFVAAMKDAKDDAIDSIAKAALETARQGEPSMQKWILARQRPEEWGDPAKRLELSGPGGGAIQTDGKLNLGALSNEELTAFLAMMEKMKADDDTDA